MRLLPAHRSPFCFAAACAAKRNSTFEPRSSGFVSIVASPFGRIAARGIATVHSVQIQEPGGDPQRLDIDGSVVVGRDCEGVVVVDPKVSRRHLVLRSADHVLTVSDLGSSNGTFVNGTPIDRETALHTGDQVQAGDVVMLVLSGSPIVRAEAPRSAPDELETMPAEGAVIRFRPGTVGEKHAPAVARAAKRARRALAGFGSEAWGL